MKTLPAIKTFDELRKTIHFGPGYETYGTMLASIELPPEELEKYARWSADHYQRIPIDTGDTYSLLLICWEPGQRTPIHQHRDEQSWVVVLEGELTETVYYNPSTESTSLRLRETNVMEKGGMTYMNPDQGLHELVNTSSGRTISIHLYDREVDVLHTYDASGQPIGDVQVP